MHRLLRRTLTLTFFSIPWLASAQTISTFWDVPNVVSNLVSALFGILVAIGVFIVAFGIFKFIANSGDEKARETGRQNILWGIIGIFIMMSIWGLVNLLGSAIQLESTTAPAIPQIPTP